MRARRMAVLAFAAVLLGAVTTIASTYVGQRRALATYPEIMGCERACSVAATGWPLIFVRDYTGMSVVNTASFEEVVFAADKLDGAAFAANLAIWSAGWMGLLALVRRRRRPRASRRASRGRSRARR